MEKTLQILEKTLYHIPMFAIEPRVRRFKKLPEYRLKKNKFTLSSFETSHPSMLWLLELFLCFQLKQNSHFCFKKEFHIKHNVRSYFEVTQVLVYIYTKYVTPGNKTLGSHLKGLNFDAHYTFDIFSSMSGSNSDSESTHSSQCDSEYNYIPGYIIEDE